MSNPVTAPPAFLPPTGQQGNEATNETTLVSHAAQIAALTASLTQACASLASLHEQVISTHMQTQAQFHALNQRLASLSSLATSADNQPDVDALRAHVLALTKSLQAQLAGHEDRISFLSRTFLHFTEQERYAITRAMVTRIMADIDATGGTP